MNKKLLILSAALFFLFHACLVKSEVTTTNCCTADALSKEPNLQLLLTHPAQCTSCTLELHMHNESKKPSSQWSGIKTIFNTLIEACNLSEQDKDTTTWINLLGLNLPAIIKIADNHANGIHGHLTLFVDDDNCSLEGTIYHDEAYNYNDWQTIIDLLAGLTSETSIKEHSPFIAQILNIVQQSNDIHGLLELKLAS